MAEGPSTDLGIAGLGPAVRIGSGGFADVYRAQQTNLRREVAVKVLRAPANEDQARMRFERECHAVGAVSGHPNIVGVHEGGFTADGRAYLVMEYFPGGSLLDRIERDGPMSAAEVTNIGLKIGQALGVAHDAGVLHRDVKPANILVSAYGEPALADFGIARVEGGQQTATGLVTASLAHASPEVLQGGPPSAASDLYSLGSTLFELFTGRAPHFRPDEESVWALMNRVISDPVPDPVAEGMPQPLASTVARATRSQPDQRHPSAAVFVAELSGESSPSAAPITRPAADAAPVTLPNPQVAPAPAPAPPPAEVPTQHLSPGQAGTPHYSPTASYPPTAETQQPTALTTANQHQPPVAPKRARGKMLGLVLVIAALASGGAYFGVQQLGGSSEVPVVFDFPAGSTGPLDAGVSYDLAVDGADSGTLFRLVLDGEPVGEPTDQLDPFVPSAGRQSVAIEITEGDVVRTSEPVELYVIGDLPAPGYRANLLSLTSDPNNWPIAIERYDELVAAGHSDLELLPSDRFSSLQPGLWNLYVPGFGDDRAAAVAYCNEFELVIPDDCFARFFDPEA